MALFEEDQLNFYKGQLKKNLAILFQCNHLNLIKPLFFEETPQQISYVMKYYKNGNLKDYLKNNKKTINL